MSKNSFNFSDPKFAHLGDFKEEKTMRDGKISRKFTPPVSAPPATKPEKNKVAPKIRKSPLPVRGKTKY